MLQDERDRVRGTFRFISVPARLFVTGPSAVVTTSWLNAAGVAIAACSLLLF
jgi:hypothetical protein